MQTAILVILGLVFIIFGILVGCAFSDDDSEVGSVARATSAFLLIIGLILLILALLFLNRIMGINVLSLRLLKSLEMKVGSMPMVILKNNMDMNELDFKDYIVLIDKDKIYLKEKD